MRLLDLSLTGTASEPLWQLLYRYWFWGWLFMDVNQGDLFRRAASWQHNLAQRIHLPVYMRRWFGGILSTGSFALLLEAVIASPLPAALFYIGATVCVVFEVVAAVAWLFLREA